MYPAKNGSIVSFENEPRSIKEISKKYEVDYKEMISSVVEGLPKVNVHYFSCQSELNTLNNEWNIFLNEGQQIEDILKDFWTLLNKFYEVVNQNNEIKKVFPQ